MKKINKIIIFMFSLLCLVLTSCGAEYNGAIYLNNYTLEYKLSETLKDGDTISGVLRKPENAIVTSTFVLAYTTVSPYNKTNYSEYTLVSFSEDLVKANDEIKYDVKLDLNKVFPQDAETKTVYFVIHSSDWDHTSSTSFSYASFNYSWNNNKVELSN